MDAGRTAPAAGRRSLPFALAVTAAVVGAAAVGRVAERTSDADLGGRLFAVLVAAGLLDVAVLARSRVPGVAWFATVLAVGIGAIEVVALRNASLVTEGAPSPGGLLFVILALLAAAGVAVLDVLRPRAWAADRVDRLAGVGAAVAIAAVAVAAAWTVVSGLSAPAALTVPPDELSAVRITGRLALATVVLGLAAGAFLDVRRGLRLGWTRWRASPSGVPRRSLLDHLAEALLPSRAVAQARTREHERARLAADLHALVLPDLRRAALAVESAGAPGPAVAGVRRALEDVEHLMHGRQSIVLEQFGLVAALEWLAERTEDQGGLRVDLELEGEGVERQDAVRPEVARAAFRIAMLAVDNVQRHAQATEARIRLRVDRGETVLVITDDGRSGAVGNPVGGRGLTDMRDEAESTGGELRLEEAPGTTVRATWRAA